VSSSKSNINTNVYIGDNCFTYGGPTNTGLGMGYAGGSFVSIISNGTPDVKNNGYLIM